MSTKLDALMPRIIQLLLMLTSNADGEVLNAAQAMVRTLANEGLDIHALVERLKPLSAGEMQKIYDKAYAQGHADGSEQGRRSAVLATAQPAPWHLSNQNVDDGVNGYTWAQIADHCVSNLHRLNDWEREFAGNVAASLPTYNNMPTAKQAVKLRQIFLNRFAGRIEQ